MLIDKPACWLSVPSQWGQEDPRPVVGARLQEELKQQIYPVHRLDFDVSGLMMYALNPGAQRAATNWLERRELHKSYQAICAASDTAPSAVLGGGASNVVSEGNFKGVSGRDSTLSAPSIRSLTPGQYHEWTSYLLRGKKRVYESPQGKLAVTRAQLIEIAGERSHWWLEPLTGRPHQLRYEIAKRGWPILGDTLYGSFTPWSEEGIALRSVKMDFSEVREKKRLGLPEQISTHGLF